MYRKRQVKVSDLYSESPPYDYYMILDKWVIIVYYVKSQEYIT